MNGMIDFYLQACLGWSYFDGQLFADTNLESLKKIKKQNKKVSATSRHWENPRFPSLFTQPPISRSKVALNLHRCWPVSRKHSGASRGQWKQIVAGSTEQVNFAREAGPHTRV